MLVSNIDGRLAWKFTSNSEFSIKTVTWANNTTINPYPKEKNLNRSGKLNLRPK